MPELWICRRRCQESGPSKCPVINFQFPTVITRVIWRKNGPMWRIWREHQQETPGTNKKIGQKIQRSGSINSSILTSHRNWSDPLSFTSPGINIFIAARCIPKIWMMIVTKALEGNGAYLGGITLVVNLIGNISSQLLMMCMSKPQTIKFWFSCLFFFWVYIFVCRKAARIQLVPNLTRNHRCLPRAGQSSVEFAPNFAPCTCEFNKVVK